MNSGRRELLSFRGEFSLSLEATSLHDRDISMHIQYPGFWPLRDLCRNISQCFSEGLIRSMLKVSFYEI